MIRGIGGGEGDLIRPATLIVVAVGGSVGAQRTARRYDDNYDRGDNDETMVVMMAMPIIMRLVEQTAGMVRH